MTAIAAIGLCSALAALASSALGADPLSAVKSIRVESLGARPCSNELAKDLDHEFHKVSGLRLAPSPNQADAIVRGECQVWIRGYVSLNPRAGSGPGRGTPIYGGYLSVELRDQHNAVLWSYLATVHTGTSDAGKDLSRQVAKALKLALEKAARKEQP